MNRRFAHRICRIETESDVVHVLSANGAPRDEKLVVLAPRELGDKLSSFCRLRWIYDFQDHLSQGIAGRWFPLIFIGREHRIENIGGAEDQIRKPGAGFLGQFRGKNVFQFVREIAQFAIAAGSGVALECVNGTADVADRFGVGRLLLQHETFFIERLQEFLRTLKEEVAEFVCPFVCEKVHNRLLG